MLSRGVRARRQAAHQKTPREGGRVCAQISGRATQQVVFEEGARAHTEGKRLSRTRNIAGNMIITQNWSHICTARQRTRSVCVYVVFGAEWRAATKSRARNDGRPSFLQLVTAAQRCGLFLGIGRTRAVARSYVRVRARGRIVFNINSSIYAQLWWYFFRQHRVNCTVPNRVYSNKTNSCNNNERSMRDKYIS